MTFATNLVRVMQAKDVDQSELARRLGISSQAVNQWVNGGTLPRPKRWSIIAKALTCDVNELTGGGSLNLLSTITPVEDDSATTLVREATGQRIQWAREAAQVDRARLAGAIGIDDDELAAIEAGDSFPTVLNVIELSTRLRVATDFLLKGVLLAQADERMNVLLAALHPELVLQRMDMASNKGTGGSRDKPDRQTRPSPDA